MSARPWQVLGIDLSLTATGVSDGTFCGTITVRGSTGDAIHLRDRRLSRIAGTVLSYVTPQTRLVVIEGPSHNSRGGHVWDRAGLWWRVVHTLTSKDLPVAVCPPACRAKYATGRGNAGKDAVMLAASKRWPAAEFEDNNQCDAAILALMGLDRIGTPLAPMPQTHRAALTGVAWPTTIQTGDTLS